MTRAATTICCGVALILGLELPGGGERSVAARPFVPGGQRGAPPPAPPPPKPAPFVVLWTQPIVETAPLAVTLTSSHVILAGADVPIEVRALDDGVVAWTSEQTFSAFVVASDGVIYAVAGQKLCALDEATGREQWTVALEAPPSGIAARAGQVLISSGTELWAYTSPGGEQLWRLRLGAPLARSIGIEGSTGVGVLADRSLIVFDLATGLLRSRTIPDVTPGDPALAGDRIYFGSSDGGLCSWGAIDASRKWCFPSSGRSAGAPLVDARFVYFALTDNTLAVLDRRTGEQKARPRLDERPARGPAAFGAYVAIPLLNSHVALVSVADHSLLAPIANPDTTTSWSMQSVAFGGDGKTFASLSVSPGGGRALVAYRFAPPAPATPRPAAPTPPDSTPPPAATSPAATTPSVTTPPTSPPAGGESATPPATAPAGPK